MAYPDFVIIGAMKCGTSTLAAQLGQQKGIFLSDPKEPNFFSDDDVFVKGLPWYSALFDQASPNDLRGEASTHYTKLPTHPNTVARMQQTLTSPRLIYMVRDPVQRAVSHFIHEWTERRMSGTIESALKQHPELIEYGLYAKQVTPFIAAYGQDAICLTSLERIKQSPQAELERIAAHIGFGGEPIWKEDLGAQNVSSERTRKLPFHGLLMGNPIARTLRRTLVPQSVRTRIAATRNFGNRPSLSAKVEAELREIFEPDQVKLAELFPKVLDVRTHEDAP